MTTHVRVLCRALVPCCALILAAGWATIAEAQEGSPQYPLPTDVESLDGIIRAYYEVVSGPAGKSADRARDESLHAPGARIGISGVDPDGKPTLQMMTLGEYHDRFGGPRANPFYEWEIHRVTQRFGNIAHVWSTYAISDTPGGASTGRGINSIQLYFDGARWWITGWVFDSERAGNPIPRQFLPTGPG
ncbi:MAG TPA: hypothetical protein VM737_02820 [Gemmatimonadota bacterium]|nr:hypothetical protein [Gemmatimonadota bacterium]